jgi:hypothetical protein
MLFETFLACSIFLITNTSLLYAAHLLVRRFIHHCPASVRLVGTGTLFYAFIVLIYQSLSPFHAISRLWVTVTCICIAGLLHVLWGKHRDFKAEVEPLRVWLRDGLKSRWAVLIIMCGFIMLLSLSRALLMPPLGWDCLSYHLTFAALWIKRGTLFLFEAPEQIISCGHLPINGEIFASWLLLPFSSDLLVNAMNFPLTFLAGVACYAVGRELGLPRWAAGWVPVLICLSPTVYDLITTAYVDNALFAFSIALVLFVLRYIRKGFIEDACFAAIAAGMAVGIKYNGIIIAGIAVFAVLLKMLVSARYSGFFKKLGICLAGLLLIISLGGRRYILNTIDAANPLYPFPLKIFSYEIFEGWEELTNLEKWVAEFDEKEGLIQRSAWEREYRKFSYVQMAPGPKFAFFLIMALLGLFLRPKSISVKQWYFIAAVWIIPIISYFAEGSTGVARGGPWADGSGRYLITSIALFTIQGLVTVQQFSSLFKKIFFFLAAFVLLDFIHLNSGHLWEVEVLYPLVIILSIASMAFSEALPRLFRKLMPARMVSAQGGEERSAGIIAVRWSSVALYLLLLVISLSLLQGYRDRTRYFYYRRHTDLHNIPRKFVGGWEFIDNLDEHKVIAFSRGYAQPNHEWFFYPLMGSRLQNDVIYLSALNKWDVPTWVDQGMLRGDDPKIWLYNLKQQKVDHVFIQEPWPIEMSWIMSRKDDFELIYTDRYCRIYKYTGQYH